MHLPLILPLSQVATHEKINSQLTILITLKKNPLTILRKSIKYSLFELRKSVNNFNQPPKKIITKLPSQNGNHTSTNNYMKNPFSWNGKNHKATLKKSSIMTSITNSFFKLMPNLRSTPNTIFYLSNNLCKIT